MARGNGEGCVYKRKGKRGTRYSAILTVGVDEDGRRIRKWQSGYATKAEAQDALHDMRAKLKRGDYAAARRQQPDTVETYLLGWLEDVRPPALKPTTWATYNGDIRRHVLPYIGDKPLTKLTGHDLDQLYKRLETSGRRDGQGGLAPKTIRGVAVTIGKALGDAQRKGIISHNPIKDSTHRHQKKGSSRASELAWGRDQLKTFLASWEGTPLYAFYRLAATTGMRRGELLGLRWSDIDLDTGKVAMVRSVVVAGKDVVTQSPKSGRGRQIHLDPGTIDVLRRHHTANAANALRIGQPLPADVFVHAGGRRFHPHWVSRRFKERRRELGLPDNFRLHDTRHLSATLSMQAGTPIKVVSERLGHASIVTTLDIYAHCTPDMQSEAAEKLASLLDGS